MRNGATREHASRRREEGDQSGLASMFSTNPDDLKDRLSEWKDILRRETRQRPGRSTAIALGAGYLLGGGLFTPLSARLVGVGLRIGLRIAFIPFVTQSLLSVGENFLRGVGAGSDESEDEDEPGERHAKNQKRSPDQKETQQ